VLVFAPPAVGKTTLLRAVTARMAGGVDPWRVAVVDTRGELGYALHGTGLLVDVLSGYPRGVGISIAARTLAAQLVVCDEIGSMEEAREITEAHMGGVPLLASAPSAGVEELLSRPAIRALHAARCFGAYVRLSRGERQEFSYQIWEWKEADEYI
jgi:stage III sporulation protein AA